MGVSDSRPVAGDGHTGILTVIPASSSALARGGAEGASSDAAALARVRALAHPPPLLGLSTNPQQPPDADWDAFLAVAAARDGSDAASTSLHAASDAAATAVARLGGWAAVRTGLAVQRQGVVTSRVLAADGAAADTIGRLKAAAAAAQQVEAAAGGLADVAAALAEAEARCSDARRALAEAEAEVRRRRAPATATPRHGRRPHR